MKSNTKLLLIFILTPIIIGSIFGLISVPNSNIDSIIPSWIFPVVWTILYTLMGISSYIVYKETNTIPKIYLIQLAFNYLWVIIFFNLKNFILAFIWLIILIVLVILMLIKFYKINKKSMYIQIPYLIWLFIALYLNYQFIN